jgi:hypothetical protein
MDDKIIFSDHLTTSCFGEDEYVWGSGDDWRWYVWRCMKEAYILNYHSSAAKVFQSILNTLYIQRL